MNEWQKWINGRGYSETDFFLGRRNVGLSSQELEASMQRKTIRQGGSRKDSGLAVRLKLQ